MDSRSGFHQLNPHAILDAVEAGGFLCTGYSFAMNSMENRVYEVELEEGGKVIAKFYRPGRWSQAAILEEHQFLFDCEAEGVPVGAPLRFPGGETLRQTPDSGIWYALFRRCRGRSPDELSPLQLRWLGGLLARIHNIGAARQAKHRPALNVEYWGWRNLDVIEGFLPREFKAAYLALCEELLEAAEPMLAEIPVHRIHGDCHFGNLIWNEAGPSFLDFDDFGTGPAVQDVWLLAPGRDGEARQQRDLLLEGYKGLRAFDDAWLKLIEPLRALRIIHYSGWIARRWDDPAFRHHFPQFESREYWREELDALGEIARLLGGAPTASHAGGDETPASRAPVLSVEIEAGKPGEKKVRVLDLAGRAVASMNWLVHGGNGEPLELSRIVIHQQRQASDALQLMLERAAEYAASAGAGGLMVEQPGALAEALRAHGFTPDDGVLVRRLQRNKHG